MILCPFCNEVKAEAHKHESFSRIAYTWYVRCLNCNAMGPNKETEAEATDMWWNWIRRPLSRHFARPLPSNEKEPRA